MRWSYLEVFLFSIVAFPTLALSQNAQNEMVFDDVELRTTFGSAEEGKDGRLAVSAESIRFTNDDGAEYFNIPSDSVTEVFYSRVSGRRIKTALVLSPLLLFSKGKKHYMTISFNDGQQLAGALEFRLDKNNYRGVLHAVESVSGVALEFDQEGIKDEKETMATAGDRPSSSVATLEITSEPDGAEIEIEGAFAGMTPRTKKLKPGKYEIKLKMEGYDDWKREIEVMAGEQVPIRAKLEED